MTSEHEPFAYEFTIRSPDGSVVTVGRSAALEGLETRVTQDALGALILLMGDRKGFEAAGTAEQLVIEPQVPSLDEYLTVLTASRDRALTTLSGSQNDGDGLENLRDALVRHGVANSMNSAYGHLRKLFDPETYARKEAPKSGAMLKRATAVALVMSGAGMNRGTEPADVIEGYLNAHPDFTYGITRLTPAQDFSDLLDRSFYRPGVGFDRDALSRCSLDVVDPKESGKVARTLSALTPHSRAWHDALAVYVEKQAAAHRNLNGAVRTLIEHDPKTPLDPKLMSAAIERACLGPHDPVVEHLREAYGGIAFVKHG